MSDEIPKVVKDALSIYDSTVDASDQQTRVRFRYALLSTIATALREAREEGQREARDEVERLRGALREVLLRHDDCDDGSGEICAACAVAMTVLGGDR